MSGNKSQIRSAPAEIKIKIALFTVYVIFSAVCILAALYFILGDYYESVPIGARAIFFGAMSSAPILLLFTCVSRLIRYRWLLRMVRTDDISLVYSADSLEFRSRSQSHQYRWVDIKSVQTDRKYLSVGSFPMQGIGALLLLGGNTPDRPTLRLRWKLARAIHHARLYPLEVEGVTVIPLQNLERGGAARLIDQATTLHRQASAPLRQSTRTR